MLGNNVVINILHRATTKVVTHVTALLTAHLMANETAYLVTHRAAHLMAKLIIRLKQPRTPLRRFLEDGSSEEIMGELGLG
jgi:hypothetical protein